MSSKNTEKKQYDIISISHFFFPRVGGLETMAYELVSYLAEGGLNVLAIYGGNKNRSANFSKFDNQEVALWSMFKGSYPLPGVIFVYKILHSLLGNPQATVIIHDRHLLTSVVTALICKALGRGYILISHTTTSNYFKNPIFVKLGNLLERHVFGRVIRNASEVIAVSETNKNYLVTNLGLGAKNCKVIYNGFNSNSVSNYKIQPKEKIVVFATKWIPVKDPDTTARSFLQLAKLRPDWKFYFIGEGDSVAKHYNSVPENLVIENRFYSKNELYELLSRSSIYINSSINEGLSLGVLEAAALGNNLVLSDAPSNMELAKELLLKKNIFKRGSVAELVRRITEQIDSFQEFDNSLLELSYRTHEKFADKVIFRSYAIYLATKTNMSGKLANKSSLLRPS